jgi:nicotinamide riboside kinase
MKTIALLGGPGSGKTELAEALRDEIVRNDGQCADCKTPVALVDGYPEMVRDSAQYEIGLDGGYMANISIALGRYNMERTFFHSGDYKTAIICGTVIESSVYSAMHFERTIKLANSDEDKLQEAQRFDASIKMMAALYMDTFKYARAYYIPPLEKPADDRWLNFERNLQAAFSAYNAPVLPLMVEEYSDHADLIKQRVAQILEVEKGIG